jgi:hypothetical protein
MASVVGICNIALSHIGKPTITDLDEASEEARQCKLHYELTRDTMLQVYPWEFAKTMIALAEIANTWQQRWQYAYQRPSDCLKARRIVLDIDNPDDTATVPMGVSEGAIYCGVSPATLEYTRKLTDPSKFPPLFQDALSWALATKIAMPLTRDQSVRKDAFQIAGQTMETAKTADANEEASSYDYPSAFISSRG